MDYKQVIVIRKDLKSRRGKEISQGAHASLKGLLDSGVEKFLMTEQGLTPHLCIPLTENVRPWIQGIFKKIVVTVDSEEQLLEIHKKAQAASIMTALIQDAGITEFNGVPTFTAVSVGPDQSDKIDLITGHLKPY